MDYYQDIFSKRPYLTNLPIEQVPSPAFVIDLQALERNLKILSEVQARSGATILLALKGFANWCTFPLVRQHLKGCCASGVWEARLAKEEFKGEVHTFAPAFSDADIAELLPITDHIVFNSFRQLHKFLPAIQNCGRRIEVGLRCNPEHSETEVEVYNPCAPGSRLGIRLEEFDGQSLDGVTGLHFHTLCQKGSDALWRTAMAFDARFGKYLKNMKWINFGGGHHITQPDYDIELLIKTIKFFQDKYGLKVYLEPGEAIGINTGSLVTTVQEIVGREIKSAIVDVSATCHMPDVLEMPYRPEIRGAGLPGEKAFTYRFGGPSCLAGDVIGEYSFDQPLQPDQRLLFDDMTHYTMVKTSTFNGIKHPAICTWDSLAKKLVVVRQFTYEDYRNRLS